MSSDAVVFEIRRVFVKDISFECPSAGLPRPVGSKVAMRVSVSTEHSQREFDGRWDVTLGISLHATDDDTGETLFIIEAKQGAIFEISGVSNEERNRLLTSECREAVFPFLRTLVWSIGAQAGLRGMLMQSMEFDALYQRALQSGETATGTYGG